MGRQWLLAKREVNFLKKSKTTGKFVREITIAARQGGPDPDTNHRLAAAIEKAKKESVSRDVIERAIQKGAGTGDHKNSLEHVTFEGYTPHKVPVIVEVFTDNQNRTAPEIRVLFRQGQLGNPGSNKFLFETRGIVEAYTSYLETDSPLDLEEVAIEAGADDVIALTHEQNNDIPSTSTEEGRVIEGARFLMDRTATHTVSQWLKDNQWEVITSEIGFIPKSILTLEKAQREEVGTFLQTLEDHDDVHRVWAAIE